MTMPAPHDWFAPKLAALLAEAEAAGIATDVSIAVITDLVNGKLARAPAGQPEEGWNRDIGEPDGAVNGPPRTAPDQSGGAAVPNPLDHLGYHGV